MPQVATVESFRDSLVIGPRWLFRSVAIALGGALLVAFAWAMMLPGSRLGVILLTLLLGCIAWLPGLALALLVRGPRTEWLRALLLSFVLFCPLLVPAGYAGAALFGWRVERWKRRGEEIAAAVEEHLRRTGRYPYELEEVPGAPELKGSLRYYSFDGSRYALEIACSDSYMGAESWIWHPATRTWEHFRD